MHIILTHEQADFDAVAAELGAYLLNKHAFPVLPRRLNRNVRAFLTLYGAELPFVDARDLPQGPIERVTLVDTQAMITLKGMGAKTAVHVVDHHQPRPDLPDNWSSTFDRVGACTTLLTEALQEHNGVLNSLHATLLLLGIYEDTGALTYAGTTVRDVQAVAFLMEAGASLKIMADYLNPPLSAEQRRLYDRLLASTAPHHIQGQNIVIASADAEDNDEEISSVAHKLRDLLDPDALFLLVSTRDGIRLVARSTTDQVDVSAVAAHFGGGGHERAAAALIKNSSTRDDLNLVSIQSVYQELLELLPGFIRPSISVGRVMSRQPRVLSPETPAEEAAQLMQRYGYEGYPVVKNGKVVGLLTRRAVDRSLAHKLNLPAASLMEAGEITVKPEDAIEHLQRVMTSSGWGQVPVIDPKSGNIIGIVTRTDLLKILAGGVSILPGKQNMASRLEDMLPEGRLALLKRIGEQAHEIHLAVYIVGGFVRDLLLDRPSFDFDIVVEGDAIALAHALAERFGGRTTSHGRFGTAKWQIAEKREQVTENLQMPPGTDPRELPESLDLISARTEFYDYPTALPTVERSSIKLDLHRRDFTINTMALRLDGRHYGDLYDYWGGLLDLRQELIRVLHSLSFVDDPTRLLRAVRFEQRFHFSIETRTRELIDGAISLLNQVSGDRLRHELNLILCEERAAEMFARLDELNLLAGIHPDLAWDDHLMEPMRTAMNSTMDAATWDLPERLGSMTLRQGLGYMVWLTEQSVASIHSIGERLRFSHSLQSALEQSSQLWQDLPTLRGASASTLVSRLAGIPMMVLYAITILQPSSEIQQMLESYARTLRHIHPYTSGDDLRELGIQPGPHYRAILDQLRAAWLDGKITSKEEEMDLLKRMLTTLAEQNQVIR